MTHDLVNAYISIGLTQLNIAIARSSVGGFIRWHWFLARIMLWISIVSLARYALVKFL